MPDEYPRPAAGGRSGDPVDLLDGLTEFVRGLPGWVGPDGYPLSWRHYVYGMAHLGRAARRELLRSAEAQRAGTAELQKYRDWHRDVARGT